MLDSLGAAHYALIAMSFAVLLLWFVGRVKKKQFGNELLEKQTEHEQELAKLKAENERNLSATRQEMQLLLDQEKTNAEQYRKEVSDNLQQQTPALGERLLIEQFLQFFEEPGFDNFTIYHHLEYAEEQQTKQVDFLIVSPKGLFVIESKMWKGITYIFNSSTPNIFSTVTDPIYASFGVRGSDKIRVFNAKTSGDVRGQIILNSYENPIAQARQYSHYLWRKLEVPAVYNLIVFRAASGYELQYNNSPVSDEGEPIGKYTTIITDKNDNIKRFFLKIRPQPLDINKVNEVICGNESNFNYRFKIDKNNYQQAPFCHLNIGNKP